MAPKQAPGRGCVWLLETEPQEFTVCLSKCLATAPGPSALQVSTWVFCPPLLGQNTVRVLHRSEVRTLFFPLPQGQMLISAWGMTYLNNTEEWWKRLQRFA